MKASQSLLICFMWFSNTLPQIVRIIPVWGIILFYFFQPDFIQAQSNSTDADNAPVTIVIHAEGLSHELFELADTLFITEDLSSPFSSTPPLLTSKANLSKLDASQELSQDQDTSSLLTSLITTRSVTRSRFLLLPYFNIPDDVLSKDDNSIAEALISSNTDLLFGGGYAYFLPSSDPSSLRYDNKNLIFDASDFHGYRSIMQRFQFEQLRQQEIFDQPVIGLFSEKSLSPTIDRRRLLHQKFEPELFDLLSYTLSYFDHHSTRPGLVIVEADQIARAFENQDLPTALQEVRQITRGLQSLRQYLLNHANVRLLLVTPPAAQMPVLPSEESIDLNRMASQLLSAEGLAMTSDTAKISPAQNLMRYTGLDNEEADSITINAEAGNSALKLGSALSKLYGVTWRKRNPDQSKTLQFHLFSQTTSHHVDFLDGTTEVSNVLRFLKKQQNHKSITE